MFACFPRNADARVIVNMVVTDSAKTRIIGALINIWNNIRQKHFQKKQKQNGLKCSKRTDRALVFFLNGFCLELEY